jgi:hypothetical protein
MLGEVIRPEYLTVYPERRQTSIRNQYGRGHSSPPLHATDEVAICPLMELAMTSTLSTKEPTIEFDLLDDSPHLHDLTKVADGSMSQSARDPHLSRALS